MLASPLPVPGRSHRHIQRRILAVIMLHESDRQPPTRHWQGWPPRMKGPPELVGANFSTISLGAPFCHKAAATFARLVRAWQGWNGRGRSSKPRVGRGVWKRRAKSIPERNASTDRVFGVATIDSACFYDFLSLWAGGLWIWVSRGFSSLWSQDRRSGVYGLESSSRTSIDSEILRRLKPSEVFFID